MSDNIPNAAPNFAGTMDFSFLDAPQNTEGEQQGSVPNSEVESTQQPTTFLDIDPKYANSGISPQEALVRTYQSKYDKLIQEHTQMTSEFQKAQSVIDLVNQLAENQDMAIAFIQELHPELIPKQDFQSVARVKLAKEFGEDFVPDRDKANTELGGKDWEYFKRLEDLYNEYKTGSGKPKTLAEIKQQKEAKAKESEIRLQQELAEVKKQLNWTDENVNHFVQWMQTLKPVDLAKIYRFATTQQKPTPIANIPGNSFQLNPRASFIQELMNGKR